MGLSFTLRSKNRENLKLSRVQKIQRKTLRTTFFAQVIRTIRSSHLAKEKNWSKLHFKHITTNRVVVEHWISSSTSGGHFIFCVSSSVSSTSLSSAGGVGDADGEMEDVCPSSEGNFSLFFFNSPLAFDSMEGIAGGSSDWIGLTGSDRRLFLT